MTVELVLPTTELYTAWQEAHAEWGPGLHEDGFGLQESDDVDTAEGFARWIARLQAESDAGTCLWIVEDGQVQGGIALRYRYNDRVGHIGYGVRPSARGRGIATCALRQLLDRARDRNLGRVLLVCAADNEGSVRTIERNGGRLDEIRPTPHGPTRRYWIDLPPRD
ncbi:GNAT family N-acetyltransferase [Microlunatus soli]|uniref:Predicted acetyltransferase n=1 Tax=Microlunatus soli TaxID=630515 RepID=A0A1H1RLS6_9ACTN|nr:GNAT family N-acetyltransferase [Microlunatus soli]SDS35919.1 Predicted acetyltransferase [Microlunatus soli]